MFDQVRGFVVEGSLVLKRQRNIFVVSCAPDRTCTWSQDVAAN